MSNNIPIHPQRTHFKYRADIDGLRAIAVLIVVGFHAFPEWLHGGYIGVDVFFVISGFLISTVIFDALKKDSFSISDFYIRRIKRIFPALLLIFTTLLVLGWFFFIPEDYEKLGKHVFAGAAFVSNLVSLSEFGYFDDAAEFKPLLHLWSLGIEEQFYIIWPIVLWCAWKFKIPIRLLLPALITCSFALNIYRSSYDTAFAFFSLQTRAWELMLGAGIGFANFERNRFYLYSRTIDKSLLSFIGLLLLLFGCVVLNRYSRFPGWWVLLPTIAAASIIIAGSRSWVNKKILAAKPLVWIGLISYPLYLWHWSLLAFFNIVQGHTPSLAIRAMLVALSLLLAWLTYRFVETPIRRSAHGALIAKILVLMMVFIGSTGLYIFYSSGLFGQTIESKLKSSIAIEDCASQFKSGKLCIFGNKNARETILIYGDSHAEHLTAALNQTFGQRYKIIFGYFASCFLSQEYINTHEVPVGCLKQVEQIKGLGDQEIKVVIHAQRWHGYGLIEKEKITQAINDSLKVFGLHPEKIIIVGSTADVDIRCAKWNYYFGNARWSKKCSDLKDSRVINEKFIDATRDFPAHNNVNFVYPYKILCTEQGCKAIENGVQLYSDTHHLTKEGALLIMPELKNIIDN